jgi:putative DNA primase/helicase
MLDRQDVVAKFYEAMRASGLSLPHGPADIVVYTGADNGPMQRCNVTAKGRAGRDDGSYVLHLDLNYAAGGFENHIAQTGWQRWKFTKPSGRLSADELRAMRNRIQLAQRERDEERGKARKEAIRVWNKAERAAEDHPYLQRKGLKTKALRQIDKP